MKRELNEHQQLAWETKPTQTARSSGELSMAAMSANPDSKPWQLIYNNISGKKVGQTNSQAFWIVFGEGAASSIIAAGGGWMGAEEKG